MWSTTDHLFLSSVTQVRLTLETAAPDGSNAASDRSRLLKAKVSPPVSQLVRLLWGEDTAEVQMAIEHIPHIVLYLSLNLDSESPKEEVSGRTSSVHPFSQDFTSKHLNTACESFLNDKEKAGIVKALSLGGLKTPIFQFFFFAEQK